MTRVRWAQASATTALARVGRATVLVRREPGTREWRADVCTRGGRPWMTWRWSEAAARRAGVQLARRLAGG